MEEFIIENANERVQRQMQQRKTMKEMRRGKDMKLGI